MASNSSTLQNQRADIVLYDGTNSVGCQYLEKTTLVEGRGTSFAGNTNSGGTTYQDATPFKRKVYDNWIGGLGQAQENTTFGGTGAGGDPTKFLDSDMHTRKTGYLIPNFYRGYVYNTITASRTPITGGVGFLGGEEQEIPAGVYPSAVGAPVSNSFSSTTTSAIANIRLLYYFTGNFPSTAASFVLTAGIGTSALNSAMGTYTVTITAATARSTTGWKWVTLVGAGTVALSSSTTYYVNASSSSLAGSNYALVGCYPTTSNVVVPYFQLMLTATPSKYWQSNLQKMEQLLNTATGAYINVALTGTALFNVAATATAGTAGSSPERLLSGAYFGSFVFNNLLYVSTIGLNGTATWDYTNASTNAVPFNALDANVVMFSPAEWGGYMFFADQNRTKIQKWNGQLPATGANAPVDVVAANTIGQRGTLINGIFFLGGFVYVIKPEGIFQLYRDPAKIDTTEVPQINKVFTFPFNHTDNGKWFTIFQNMLFVNCRDMVYQLAFGGTNGTQAQPLKPDFQRYRLTNYLYVNGITTDGRQVYASWNNLGVFSYVGASWHKEFEYYETVAVESQASGLRWLPNPTSAPDYLYCGDGRTIVKLPCPNAFSPYTQQIHQDMLNKCAWLITSGWDGDLSEITKYIQSVVLRAILNGWQVKVSAVALPPTGTASWNSLVELSMTEGLYRDSWVNPTGYVANKAPTAIVTTKMTVNGSTLANTLAPACWISTDFDNQRYSSEKLAVGTTDTTATPDTTEILSYPVKLVQTAFIIFLWNTTPQQFLADGTEIPIIDSVSVKYQPIQDYLPTYQVTIDVDSMIMEQAEAITVASVNDCVTQVRAWAGRHSPVQASFQTSEGIKTVNAFVQDARFEYDPLAGGTLSDQPNPKRIFLTLIGVDPEYQGT